MVRAYDKPHLTLVQQVERLRQRGMAIPDDRAALRCLNTIGYYRLSGYYYTYRRFDRVSGRRTDHFAPGTTFDQVLALYEFDRRLKLLVLDAVERIEIMIRVRVGHTLGERGTFAHLDESCLDGKFTRASTSAGMTAHETWLRRVKDGQARSQEDFVRHFRETYEGQLPVWVVTEILDFGSLSSLYAGMMRRDRDAIAVSLGIHDVAGGGNGRALANWLQAINFVRNTCAHHSRLWNRNMTVQIGPKALRPIKDLKHVADRSTASTDRIYATLCVVSYLLERAGGASRWRQSIRRLIPAGLAESRRSTYEMGIPPTWESESVWR